MPRCITVDVFASDVILLTVPDRALGSGGAIDLAAAWRRDDAAAKRIPCTRAARLIVATCWRRCAVDGRSHGSDAPYADFQWARRCQACRRELYNRG